MAKKKKSLREKLPYSEYMIDLIEHFATLPGIGEKSAEKLAYHIMMIPKDDAMKLARSIANVKQKMTVCEQCFNLTIESPCKICKDESRDRSTICVVEQPKDLWAIEKTGQYKGLYHILTGRLSPLEGVTIDNLTIKQLAVRIRKSQDENNKDDAKFPINEVIIATNPDFEGDGTMLAVNEALSTLSVKITKIARGLPTGGSIEMSSPAILAEALTNRNIID
ncbi:MAG: recombination protein RecR [Candidatus Heimdallarchaeota archaeon]|nr:recombination protein RecR [Candidatus Heimdallarchaeota archaeon]